MQGIGAHYTLSRKKNCTYYPQRYIVLLSVLLHPDPELNEYSNRWNLITVSTCSFVSQESAVNAGCLNFHWNWAGCDEMCSFMFCCKLKISHQSDHKDIKPLERLRGISNSTWRTPTTNQHGCRKNRKIDKNEIVHLHNTRNQTSFKKSFSERVWQELPSILSIGNN